MGDFKLSQEEIDRFWKIALTITETENFLRLKEFTAHGKTTTFSHCINVAKLSYFYSIWKSKKVDFVSLIRGALLHDYYFYDWHKNKPFTFHGFTHPKIALENALKDFELNKIEKNIIRSHMFPLTIFHFPRCKEALIVSMCDKKIAKLEMKGVYNADCF